MSDIERKPSTDVTLWFDPVCPYAWNTARWLTAAADVRGFEIDWQTMSLAVLNEGREMPPAQQARMADSGRVGRVMAGIRRELGAGALAKAYFAFGERYFDQGVAFDEVLAKQVLAEVSSHETAEALLADAGLDELVRASHLAGQEALGETGGSPILRIDGHAFFGPVLTSVPSRDEAPGLFDAIAVLARTPQFSQLQRPRNGAGK